MASLLGQRSNLYKKYRAVFKDKDGVLKWIYVKARNLDQAYSILNLAMHPRDIVSVERID